MLLLLVPLARGAPEWQLSLHQTINQMSLQMKHQFSCKFLFIDAYISFFGTLSLITFRLILHIPSL